ncbi:hypothetical protein C5167_026168 [Papaver somniferum]|nr:hypothetical protein C5167_026168 [Papaver somniferum]
MAKSKRKRKSRNQQQDVHKVFVEMRLRKQWEARVFNGSIYNHKMDCCADWFNGSEVFVKLGNGLTGVLLSLEMDLVAAKGNGQFPGENAFEALGGDAQ